MDIQEVAVKQDVGICRCCHAEGCFRDMSEECVWMDKTEIYGDMLQECFNLRILQYPNGHGINGAALICEDCITQLREACTFRRRVLDNERKLAQMLGQVDQVTDGLTIKIETEQEPCKSEVDIDIEEHGVTSRHYTAPMDVSGSCLMGAPDSDAEDSAKRSTHSVTDGLTIKIETEQEPCKSEVDIDIEEHGVTSRHYTAPMDVSGSCLMGAPDSDAEDSAKRSTHSDSDDDSAKKRKIAEKANRARAIVKWISKPKSDLKWVRTKTPKQKHADNLHAVLKHSNAIYFKNKSYLGYICGYCDLNFLEPAVLRTHTENEHKEDLLDLQSMKIAYIGVKLDITDLKCLLCNENMNDLSTFKDHIVNAHDKVFYNDVKDHMFPFKLHKNLNECVLCNSSFETFKMLYLHMHTHFPNYSCSKCESTFATNKSLISHRYIHKDDHFECSECNKVFTNKAKLHQHSKYVHADGKTSYCPICKKKFPTYYQRNVHMIGAHDTDVFTCNVCNEKFALKAVLLRHMKVTHKM